MLPGLKSLVRLVLAWHISSVHGQFSGNVHAQSVNVQGVQEGGIAAKDAVRSSGANCKQNVDAIVSSEKL